MQLAPRELGEEGRENRGRRAVPVTATQGRGAAQRSSREVLHEWPSAVWARSRERGTAPGCERGEVVVHAVDDGAKVGHAVGEPAKLVKHCSLRHRWQGDKSDYRRQRQTRVRGAMHAPAPEAGARSPAPATIHRTAGETAG